ncbi:hypothetical protein [Paraburkholderia atlantica]|uniref:hypothetical protein n=1 Tax=Paraburkholderia atlantica TaxID=2654982 RepID=UPI003D225C0B
MNPRYCAFIDLGKTLASEKGLSWEMPLDEIGTACDGVGWNLTVIAGDVPPPNYYLRDFGPEVKALAIINAERAGIGLTPLPRQPLSAAWQDLIKAAVVEQLLFKRNTTGHVLQHIARPLRVVATCVEKAPWELTVDDLHLAIRVGRAIQTTGKLGDLVIGIIKIVLDSQHICDAGQLYVSLAAPRMKMKTAIKAKHTWSRDELRADLEARKRDERLPERKAFCELTRIVMTEKPRTFMDDLRFAAVRTMIVTGMRAGEAALLPVDWKRERTYLDSKGRPAGEAGGISTSLMARHFAEKQQDDESDSRVLRENTAYGQPVLAEHRAHIRFRERHDIVNAVPGQQAPRLALQLQRLAQWLRKSSNVIERVRQQCTEHVRYRLWREPFIERYRKSFDPEVLIELHRYQAERPGNGPIALDMAVYQFGKRLLDKMSNGEIALRFRRADGKVLGVRERLSWHNTYLHVGELEDHIRATTPTKVSDATPLALAVGVVQPWEFLFVQPKRSLAEERNDGLCDVARFMSVSRPTPRFIGLALGDDKRIPSLFEKYGQTDEDRAMKMESHMLRHLQNTELFRLGVADTIISKRFNRRSIAQSYEYDHRSLAEDLDQIEIPQKSKSCSGKRPARLPGSSRAAGPAAQSWTRSTVSRRQQVTPPHMSTFVPKQTVSMPHHMDIA